jgi:hypothetical protein
MVVVSSKMELRRIPAATLAAIHLTDAAGDTDAAGRAAGGGVTPESPPLTGMLTYVDVY